METLDAIRKRCSLKLHLSKKPIEPEKIEQVLEAARLAPSARNLQPWRFVVVKGDEAIEELVLGAFPESNQALKNGSVVILICAREEDDVSREGRPYYLFDTGLAAENLMLAATDLGLLTHPILSFDENEAKRILEIPDEYRVVLATPLSYPTEASYEDAADERLRERTRKAIGEITYFGKWGVSKQV
ncbi:MAG: nitroreductase family protein [Gaiellaceae bacterium]